MRPKIRKAMRGLSLALSGVLVLSVLVASATVFSRQETASAQFFPVVQNPSFEGEYIQYDNGPVMVAPGWTPFWSLWDPPHEKSQGPARRPEYKPVLASQFGYRVTEGDKSQCLFAFSGVMDAGVHQQITVQRGKKYRFSLDAQAWSSNTDNPRLSDGEMYIALGIDPWGRTDPFELGVVWTYWMPIGSDYRRVESMVAEAQSEHITIFIRVWNKWRLKHNDGYLDRVEFKEVQDGAMPTPTPVVVTPVPTRPGPVACPSLDDIRGVVREEIDNTDIAVKVGPQ